MARSLKIHPSTLLDLDAPSLELRDGEMSELILARLRMQNTALDLLRDALASEDRRPAAREYLLDL